MGWSTAWHNPIFFTYLVILIAVMILAGGTLAIFSFGLKRDIRSIWLTYRSWLVMAPLVAVAVGAGRVATIIMLGVLAMIGFKEFARATGLYRDWWMTGAVYLAIIATAIALIVPSPLDGLPGWYGLFMSLPIYAISLFILVPI